MQQFDPNWHPQPYPQWGNKEPTAPRVVDIASQPNDFPQQNAQALSAFQTPMHQDFEKHQTASVEVRTPFVLGSVNGRHILNSGP